MSLVLISFRSVTIVVGEFLPYKEKVATRLGDRRARQLSLTSAKGGYTVHRRAPRFSFATIICLLALDLHLAAHT